MKQKTVCLDGVISFVETSNEVDYKRRVDSNGKWKGKMVQ